MSAKILFNSTTPELTVLSREVAAALKLELDVIQGTFEQGVACFTSPEYDRAAAFRRKGAGEVETIIVEGGDPSR